MHKHEQKYCPRCTTAFTCKAGDIANCQCSCVALSPEAIRLLGASYYDCLCKDCLSDINQLAKTARSYQFPSQKEMLIEGLHFYKEGPHTVFTDIYHILRGNCCGNGCRHCPYGFKKKSVDTDEVFREK